MEILLIYLVVVNIFAVVITVYDKFSAIKGKNRVSERTLMTIAAIGGAPMMYLTMLIIRHKTRKPLFMIGIPVILILELLVIYLVLHYGFKTI